MDVRVCGPNLNDQSKGTFHVHRHDCGHLRHYGPGRKFGGDVDGLLEMRVANATVLSIVVATYADQIAEQPEAERHDYVEELVSDFHFAPCLPLGFLPYGDNPYPLTGEVDTAEPEPEQYAAVRIERSQQDDPALFENPEDAFDTDFEVFVWTGDDAEQLATAYVMAQPIDETVKWYLTKTTKPLTSL